MEIKSLTGVRGIAALYVVAFHLIPQNFGGHIDNFLINGYLSVDFFFLLSGFIMSMVHNEFSIKGKGDYTYFLFKRFVRIYPLYIFLYIATQFLVLLYNGNKESYISLLINGFLLQSLFGYNYIQSSWSISTELFAYLSFPLMLFVISKTKYITPVFLAVLSALIYLSVNNQILSLSLGIAGGWQSILRCLADYSLGIIAFVLYKNGNVINKITSYSLTALLFILLIFRPVDIFVVLICAAIIPSLIDNTNVVSKALSTKPVHYLGQISYSLYLVHSLFINQLNFIFNGLGNGKLPAIFAASILTSIATYHFIEQPCRIWLTSRGSKFKQPAM